MNKKIEELCNLLFRANKIPIDMRLFLISETRMIRIYKGKFSFASSKNDFGNFLPEMFNRGDVLDCFAKLEFFVNEIIQMIILGFASEKSSYLDDMLDNIDLFSRIRLLKRWGIIDNKIQETLMALKEVRNGLAHKWEKEDVTYRSGNLCIPENFNRFKDDFKGVWEKLVTAYYLQLSSKNIDEILKRVNNLNSNQGDLKIN